MEKFLTQEVNKIEQLRVITEAVGDSLKSDLEKNFSSLEYHNIGHSVGVAKNALYFLSTEQIEPYEILLVEVAGLGHDIDQTFLWQPAFSGIGMRRVRDTGIIEDNSAKYVLQKLQDAGLVIEDDTQGVITEAILGTVPMYNADLKTVTQPNVNKYSKRTTWAIAAADLATAGFNSDNFLHDGDAVWNEDRMLPKLENLDDDDKNRLREELISWTKNQISYVEGQKIYWNREDVPEFIKNKLTNFDQSIDLCKKRYDKRKDMSLLEIIEDMNFNRFETK